MVIRRCKGVVALWFEIVRRVLKKKKKIAERTHMKLSENLVEKSHGIVL